MFHSHFCPTELLVNFAKKITGFHSFCLFISGKLSEKPVIIFAKLIRSLLTPTWTAFSEYNWTGLTLLNGFSFLVIFPFLFWVVQ